MVEKVSTVRNPLTIIAIFAGISEISGTAILPFIDKANQEHYIWFLMLFPTLLVILFFGTLWVRHSVLYAPSDYRDEKNFLKTLPASEEEIEEKLEEEVKSVTPVAAKSEQTPTRLASLSSEEVRARYRAAEDYALREIASEYNVTVSREVRLQELRESFVFDGIFIFENLIHVVEVKYFRGLSLFVIESLYRMIHALMTAPEISKKAKIVLTVVTEESSAEERRKYQDRLQSRLSTALIPVLVRVYEYESLKQKWQKVI